MLSLSFFCTADTIEKKGGLDVGFSFHIGTNVKIQMIATINELCSHRKW